MPDWQSVPTHSLTDFEDDQGVVFTSVPLATFHCTREGAPDSLSAAAMYTSVRMREKSQNVPWNSISFHVQNAWPAGKCDPHLITSSGIPIRTARLRRPNANRGNLCHAKYTGKSADVH